MPLRVCEVVKNLEVDFCFGNLCVLKFLMVVESNRNVYTTKEEEKNAKGRKTNFPSKHTQS